MTLFNHPISILLPTHFYYRPPKIEEVFTFKCTGLYLFCMNFAYIFKKIIQKSH